MSRKGIKPFANESDCLQIMGISIENRVDRVSIFGSIDITRDKEGLAAVRELKTILDLTLSELESAELPDKVTMKPTRTVKNPFE